jgi:hypothetical protein
MGTKMSGSWKFIDIENRRTAQVEFGESILKALNELPVDARASAQVLVTRLSPSVSVSPSRPSPIFASGALIFYFAPEAEPVPFVAVPDGDPDF